MKKKPQNHSFQTAFTMLELVFVIVVAGILAAVMIPNTRTNPLQEAAIQLVSHIRYTQHLAMVDDQFDINDNKWFQGRWQIAFNNANTTENRWSYSIYSDAGVYTGSSTESEIASDPVNKSKLLSGGSSAFNTSDAKANQKMNIGKSYGVDTVLFSGGCSNNSKKISFDHLGRPIAGAINGATRTTSYNNINLLSNACVITLSGSNEDNVTIVIEPETGYAHIEQI